MPIELPMVLVCVYMFALNSIVSQVLEYGFMRGCAAHTWVGVFGAGRFWRREETDQHYSNKYRLCIHIG